MEQLGLLIAVAVALAAAVATGQVLARLGFPIPDAHKRIGCVDGLRGYLALLVMMHHFDLWIAKSRYGAHWGASSSQLFENFGPGGVGLFFMTTGLVFYPRIAKGFSKVDWRATYASRVFRILPLQLVMVAVAVVISLYMARESGWGDARGNLRSLAMWVTSYAEPQLFGYQEAGSINAYVLWSLWYEWMFYLFVLPILAVLRDLTRDRMPGYAIPLLLLLVGLAAGRHIAHPAVMFYLPLFACGMLAHELRETPQARHALTGRLATVVAVVALGAAAIWADGPFVLPQLLAYALFFACIAAGNAFGGLFALRGSVVLGEISFGIYLIHGTVLYVLFTFVLPRDVPEPVLLASLPLAAVAAVLVSAGAYLCVERRGIEWGRRLYGRPRERLSPRVERAAADVAP